MSTERPGHPHADSAVARFLAKRIDELRGVKSQREIAAEAGFQRPNILSMIKTGETALPMARIPALARALDADSGHLLRLAFLDQAPELGALINDIFGQQLASANEHRIFLVKWPAASGSDAS